MQVITLSKAKANFYKLIEKVESGQSFIITQAGKPVSKLEPYKNEGFQNLRW